MWTSDSLEVIEQFPNTSSTSLVEDNIGKDNSDNELSYSVPFFNEFCEQLQVIGGTYNIAHGYASLIVCSFGTVANILNLIILTRKEMINSTNLILTGLAFADLLTMVEYVPYAVYMYFLPDPVDGGRRKTYAWALYVLIHSNFSQVCHTIAIWLTVTVAVWRYLMISMPLRCRTLCSMERAKWILYLAYLICPVLCIPIYLAFSIRTVLPGDSSVLDNQPSGSVTVNLHLIDEFDINDPVTELYTNLTATSTISTLSAANETLKYMVNLSDLARRNQFIVTVNFWVYSVVLKITPCILLTVVSVRLITSLMKVRKRKKMLLGLSSAKSHGNKRVNGHLEVEAGAAMISTSAFCPENPSSVILTAPPPSSQVPPRDEEEGETDGENMAETTLTVEIPEKRLESVDRSVAGGVGNTRRMMMIGSFTKSSSGEMYLTRRTTTMLLLVLILFLLTEFPQGILALFSDLMGDDFFKRCYIPMANLMDFLALFNAALNFILYFCTSIRFRATFLRMLSNARVYCTGCRDPKGN